MKPQLAVLAWNLALAVAAGAVLLVLRSDHADSKAATIALAVPIGLAFAASGLLAATRRPENRTGLLLVLTGFTWFLGALAEANGSVPFTLGLALGSVTLGFLVHLLLAFPSGRLGGRLDRTIAGVAYAVAVLGPALTLLFDDLERSRCDGCPENALLIEANQGATQALEGTVVGGALLLIAAIVVQLIRRWRAASPPLRRSLAPVLATGTAALTLVAAANIVGVLSDAGEPLYWLLQGVLFTVPISFALGLLRSHLARAGVGRLVVELGHSAGPHDLRGAFSRALGDPSLEVAYRVNENGWVGTGGRPLERPSKGSDRVATFVERDGRCVAALIHDASLADERELVAAVSAAGALALEGARSLQELRASEARNRALLDAIPDLMFRIARDGTYLDAEADEEEDLTAPADQIVGSNVFDRLPRDIGERLMRSIHRALSDGETKTIEYELELRGEPRSFEGRVVASGEDEVLVIVRNITERKRKEDELRRLYVELERGLGELQASRARIVEAADLERRRLERNLHDGAQQRLVSISLALRLARGKLLSEPPEAETLLRGAGEELGFALEELRELARGIHPAILTDRGLAPALESLASRSPVPVDVQGPSDRLPPWIETAAYYVVSEALTNAAKYAEASEVSVRVARANGDALVEVRDNGVGGASPDRGSGLRGLADRVSALGGRLRVESEPGAGTFIRAEIPLATVEPAAG